MESIEDQIFDKMLNKTWLVHEILSYHTNLTILEFSVDTT